MFTNSVQPNSYVLTQEMLSNCSLVEWVYLRITWHLMTPGLIVYLIIKFMNRSCCNLILNVG